MSCLLIRHTAPTQAGIFRELEGNYSWIQGSD